MDKTEKKFTQEFTEFCNSAKSFTLTLQPAQAWMLLGQLQLALRHPDNRGAPAEMAFSIAKQLEAYVSQGGPTVAMIAAFGWQPKLDVPA
jgi:hypothetical protein